MSDADQRRSQRGLQKAAREFVDTVTRDGGSASITFEGKTVHIGKAPTADGEVGTDHNEGGPQLPLDTPAENLGKKGNVGRLKEFIERIEKLEEERAAVGSDVKDVYSEAKGVGFDIKTIRKIVALRKLDAADRDEQEALLDTYKHALGMS